MYWKKKKGTEPIMETEITKIATKNELGAYKANPISLAMDLLGLTEQVKKEYATAATADKIRLFYFFISGVALTYGMMIVTLWALDLPSIIGPIAFASIMTRFVLSQVVGFAFAFVAAKFKQYIPTLLESPEKLKDMIVEMVGKL